MREVAGELLHLPGHLRVVPVFVVDQHAVIRADYLVPVAFGGLRIAPGREILLDLTEDPGIRRGRAPYHDGVAARLGHHAGGVFGRLDVTVAYNRYPNRHLDCGNARPVRMPGEALLAGASVQRYGLDPTVLGQPRHPDVYNLVLVPARAELDGKPYLHCRAD